MKKLYMPVATLILGLILNALGLLSYGLTDTDSWTPLIPAFIGGVFLIAFGISLSPKLRPHAIHGALALAVILALYSLYKVSFLLAHNDDPAVSSALRMFSFETTAVACLSYITLGVRSFIVARKARRIADNARHAADQH